MLRSAVAVVGCSSYNQAEVDEAVQRGIELLGGTALFVKRDERITLKPNVLWGDNPEKCITTHPSVFRAVGIIFKEAGAILQYGDSPGFGRPESHMKRAGLKAAAEELGIPLADFEHGREVEFPDSPYVKRFTVAYGALDCDGIVNLPKLKTHGFLRLTGAVKNSFGCIPGMLTQGFHVKIPNPYEFSRMLVSLNLLLKPRIHIMDGIVAMDGNGPRGGHPVKMGVLLFSADPVALDTVMCRIVRFDPALLPTNTIGAHYGLGTSDQSEIELLGDPIERFSNHHFDVLREPIPSEPQYRVPSLLKNAVFPRPVIQRDRCVRCGTCVEVCPVEPKALNWKNGDRSHPPAYTYKRCIRCFCCQEICPESAIYIKHPPLRKLLVRVDKTGAH
jgi:uncharacterized protein (DUF362 family)/ferredoxin